MSVPQFDRDPTFLFFWQAIGIGASQRTDQRRFAVVDMASSAKNQIG